MPQIMSFAATRKQVRIGVLLIASIMTFAADSHSRTRAATLSDNDLLSLLQQQTIDYFWTGAETHSGLARERIHTDNIYPQNDQDVVTSGGSGFGLMALIVGLERGLVPKTEALAHFEKNLTFLETADRFHGAWPHWWHGPTGKTKPFSKKDDGGDLVETAFLTQGLLTLRQYFANGTPRERAIAHRCDQLWKEVEWSWYTKGNQDALYWHWSPQYGWEMNFRIGGYNECLIVYLLAASSPTHGVRPEVYHSGWARDGAIRSDRKQGRIPVILDHYEHDNALVGPLFWAHYSYLGLDPRGLTDTYADYWQLNQNHAVIHYNHCVENPNHFAGYGPSVWGLTSSYSMKGYAGHRPDRDLGVISPTAALASFPYTPQQSMRFLRSLYEDHPEFIGPYGPYDAFSLEHQWHLKRYLAIDQGPIPVMIENYRTGLIWNLFMSAPEIKAGLEKLGFKRQ